MVSNSNLRSGIAGRGSILILLQVDRHGDHALLAEVAREGISGAGTNTAGVTPSRTFRQNVAAEIGQSSGAAATFGGGTYIVDYVGGNWYVGWRWVAGCEGLLVQSAAVDVRSPGKLW